MAVFFIFCSLARTASAAERLSYAKDPGQRSRIALGRYAQETMDLPLNTLRIAAADLNQDGLSEYILHGDECGDGNAFCRYDIVADTQKGIIPLGTITGKTLLLGDGFSHGVRDLLASENELNDYDQTLYVWTPEKAAYRKKTP